MTGLKSEVNLGQGVKGQKVLMICSKRYDDSVYTETRACARCCMSRIGIQPTCELGDIRGEHDKHDVIGTQHYSRKFHGKCHLGKLWDAEWVADCGNKHAWAKLSARRMHVQPITSRV